MTAATGSSDQDPAKVRDFASGPTGPMKGARVIDLSRLVAGNMLTHILADFGAEVLKLERPEKGDDLRNWRVRGVSLFWKVYARNKKSVTLDLRREDGREILLSLVETASILVENFVPGTLEGWGLGPDASDDLSKKSAPVRMPCTRATPGWSSCAFPGGAKPGPIASVPVSARWSKVCPASRP